MAYAEAKKKDAERKKYEQLSRQYDIGLQPEKYREQLFYEKKSTCQCVRKCRARKAENSSSQITQENEKKTAKHKTLVEEKQLELKSQKRHQEARRIQNCTRVKNYRLRVKLMTPSGLSSSKRLKTLTVNESEENVETAVSDTSTGLGSGYQHTSSTRN